MRITVQMSDVDREIICDGLRSMIHRVSVNTSGAGQGTDQWIKGRSKIQGIKTLIADIQNAKPSTDEPEKGALEQLADSLAGRMEELDTDTPSGEDFNLLWDAILDEVRHFVPRFLIAESNPESPSPAGDQGE